MTLKYYLPSVQPELYDEYELVRENQKVEASLIMDISAVCLEFLI